MTSKAPDISTYWFVDVLPLQLVHAEQSKQPETFRTTASEGVKFLSMHYVFPQIPFSFVSALWTLLLHTEDNDSISIFN